jgi:hypothetical protein
LYKKLTLALNVPETPKSNEAAIAVLRQRRQLLLLLFLFEQPAHQFQKEEAY